jgi:ribonuclease G
MQNEILIDASKESTRVAVLEDKNLVELYVENQQHEKLVGNIYRGKVSSVLPGMQAAFIDIGYEKNAFLYAGDILPHKSYETDQDTENQKPNVNIKDLLKEGQEITVQVIKEPIDTKGPRVSANITLPGRHLVLLPNADYIGISRRIEDESEKERLREMVEKVKPQDVGVIVRTAAENLDHLDFEQDIEILIKLWKSIMEKEQKGTVPRILYKELDLIYKVTRDLFTDSIDKLIVNDQTTYEQILSLVDMFSPSLKKRVSLFCKETPLFEFYEVESQIEHALTPKVWLKCGGYLVIDQTEALTIVDVNTGKYVGNTHLEETVLKTNLDAAREIAKQIRLRDIGGIIIIDFIDMKSLESQQMVLDKLKQELKKDRTKTMVVGITPLGLVEMTRKKIRQNLSSALTEECPHCHGTGKVRK